jgi:hypothetical protein
MNQQLENGGVAERLNAAVLKTWALAETCGPIARRADGARVCRRRAAKIGYATNPLSAAIRDKH